MKTFLLSCVAAIVISVGAFYVLTIFQEPSAVVYSTDAVRLDPANQKH